MRRYGKKLLLSSGDLSAFLGCRHAFALDLLALDNKMDQLIKPDPTLSTCGGLYE